MKKVDYKHGRFIILASEIDTDNFDREDYEAYCEDNGFEVGDEDDFYDWCAEETQCNYEADMDNIRRCKQYQVPVAVTGTLGLWWGHPEIEPRRFESVYDALMECITGGNDVCAEFNNGVILVDVYHHDGCNSFTIRALSQKGQKKATEDYKEHDFKRLPYLYAI